jgi:pyridoxine 5-phosphate synthase
MPELGLNIDHIATLREARYRNWTSGLPPEPDVLDAARVAEKAGAHAITVHLREDRRHIQEADVKAIARAISVPLNLEMAATPAMIKQALKYKPEEVCLVPENREEVTTEGGLEVAGDFRRIQAVVRKLAAAKIEVSAFIDADPRQVEASHRAGAHIVELHTGAYANATTLKARRAEISRHARAAAQAEALGLRVNAGHGLNYANVREYIEEVPHLRTLNIGHAIISRAVFVGLDRAVREMLDLLGARSFGIQVD